jgi:hypothetical protein
LIECAAFKVFFSQLYSAYAAIERLMDNINERAAIRLFAVSDKVEMEVEQG